jgi:hypothetical protein
MKVPPPPPAIEEQLKAGKERIQALRAKLAETEKQLEDDPSAKSERKRKELLQSQDDQRVTEAGERLRSLRQLSIDV